MRPTPNASHERGCQLHGTLHVSVRHAHPGSFPDQLAIHVSEAFGRFSSCPSRDYHVGLWRRNHSAEILLHDA